MLTPVVARERTLFGTGYCPSSPTRSTASKASTYP